MKTTPRFPDKLIYDNIMYSDVFGIKISVEQFNNNCISE